VLTVPAQFVQIVMANTMLVGVAPPLGRRPP
jgi:hypothetical protein